MCKATLELTCQVDFDAEFVVQASADGKVIMRVTVDANDPEDHKITTWVAKPGLSYYEQACIIKGAAELIDAQFTDAEPVYEIEY